MEAQRTGLQEQFNQRYLLISAGNGPSAGALLLALFYYGAFRTWRRVRRFFQLRILEKRAALFPSTGGAFSAISRSDCMPRWRSSSVSWPVTSG